MNFAETVPNRICEIISNDRKDGAISVAYVMCIINELLSERVRDLNI